MMLDLEKDNTNNPKVSPEEEKALVRLAKSPLNEFLVKENGKEVLNR
jgi:hypothetical protein